MNINDAYALGCISICLQQDKDLEVRNLALKLMAGSNKQPEDVQEAFGTGRLDTAVHLSKRRARIAEKRGTRQLHKSKRS